MIDKIGILGAGGHTRTLINALSLLGYSVEGIYDANYNSSEKEIIEGIELKGNFDQVPEKDLVVISKGNCSEREELYKAFEKKVLSKNIVHPSALVETRKIGIANQILAMSFISNTSKIGNNNIIYSNTSIEHEAILGDHNVITMNVAICGRVKIGNRVFIGAGASILPGTSICDNVIIGAGAVVTKDITESGTYVGVPAKKISK